MTIQSCIPRLHKKHKPRKNRCLLLGLGLKFIPMPTLTNSWTHLKQSHMIDCSDLCTSDSTSPVNHPVKTQQNMTPKCMSIPNGHCHIGQSHRLPWRNAYHTSPKHLVHSLKHERVKPTCYPTNIESYGHYNNNKHSFLSLVIKTWDL